jgi:hypothetical protein
VTLSDTQRRWVRVVIGVVAVSIAIPITFLVAWFVYSRYMIWRPCFDLID